MKFGNEINNIKVKRGSTNFSYFPVIFESEDQLLKIEKALNAENIFPRRYFYPSVNTSTSVVDYQKTPISEDIAKRILCLPFFWKLSYDMLHSISQIILRQ